MRTARRTLIAIDWLPLSIVYGVNGRDLSGATLVL